MDLCKPFEIKDIAKNHQIYIANQHRIYDIQKKIDNNTATAAERQEQQEKIAWNVSFRQFLKKTGL